MPKTPAYIAQHIRRVLLDGASAPHSAEVQWFFKEQVKSRGWYTAELRKVAVRFSRTIVAENGLPFLVQVADQLFRGDVLEEKVFAVLMLQGAVGKFGAREFKLFESWLDRISSWADHDALCSYIIGPMMVNEPRRTARALTWTRSPDRWHRRAACVSLIRGVRLKHFELETEEVCRRLLHEEDEMVQKGLGWLLREATKYNPDFAVPLLKSIRKTAPRLVLRTGCETLNSTLRTQILNH